MKKTILDTRNNNIKDFMTGEELNLSDYDFFIINFQ